MFLASVSPESVVSYVDFNHTTQTGFLESCGFTYVKDTGPALIWHKKNQKAAPNTSLLRLGADRILGTSYGPVRSAA